MNFPRLDRTNKILLTAAFCSQLASLAALPALADTAVHIGARSAFSVPLGAGGLTAAQRTGTMQKNIDNALVASTDKSPQAVAISLVNGQPVLTLGGFYVGTADSASASKLGLTPRTLAQKWAAGLKSALNDPTSVDNYISQLTGKSSVAQAGTTTTTAGSYPYYRQGKVVYIPAGMTMPVVLETGVSSGNAKAGDKVEANLAQAINLGQSEIPANSVLIGQVTDVVAAGRLSHGGHLGLKFTKLRLPDGTETPIVAHIVGGIGKFSETSTSGQSDELRGESTKQKVERAALHGAIGAGGGALVGTVVGAIASRGYGTGRGALSGLVLGGALGVGESLLLHKGNDVNVGTGNTFNVLLDAPASVSSM